LRWADETATDDPVNYILALWEALENTNSFYSKVNFGNWLENHTDYYSAWSDVAVKYALPAIDFSLWGGMPATMTKTPPSTDTDRDNLTPYKLTSEVTKNKLFLSDETYKLIGQLSFVDSDYPVDAITEFDQLMWY
jgi:hypothetical protein